jgi:Ca2+-binding RTX toxin-like protein
MGRAWGLLLAALIACACLPAAASAASSEAPTCAEGPQRVGDTVEGTPCGETIVAPAGVTTVQAGGGDDTIVATPIPAAAECEGTCLGVRSPIYEGGPGDDLVFGERGNDIIRGNAGNDRLFGGIGDDLLEGGEGDDVLSGGFGADSIDGQAGGDYVRGDGTTDRIFDSGSGGETDTLSYGTAVVPGFGGGIVSGDVAGFPNQAGGERGVYLDLSAGHAKYNGSNGGAAEGGGSDQVETGAFETIVGSPYSDYIVGGEGGETIYGGGGADLIEGRGGDDHLFGGADGDDLDGGVGNDTADGGSGANRCEEVEGAVSCSPNPAKAVVPRDAGKVAVGLLAPGLPGHAQLYLTGSGGADQVTATYSAGPPASVTFTLLGGSFDSSAGAESNCGFATAPARATCTLAAPLDSIVLAGLGGDDHLSASGFPQQTGVVLLGGEGGDELTGGEGSEDLLVSGADSSRDVLNGLGRDDALLHQGANGGGHGGADELRGGEGNDLFLSTSICDGESISGEAGLDNASWARLGPAGVAARLDLGRVGEYGAPGEPGCNSGTPDTLAEIEDLEGSEFADLLVGDGGENQLLGHKGPDEYFAGAGSDRILANSADSDPVINCGPDQDTATIDIPTASYADAAPVECETVIEAGPEEFRTITQLPPPPLPPVSPAPPKQPKPDRTPPRTTLRSHPPKLLRIAGRHRRVAFRFSSNEAGSSFRCKLDRKPYRGCASPRIYTVGLGRHAVRVVAVDVAGNADRTPAVFQFRVVRRR